ncbi:hypothetical protein ACTFIY_007319 [Dictyostelium cf. discoideum]
MNNYKNNGNGEILFWSIWRNVFLKRIILNNFLNKKKRIGSSYRYNQCISILWMLKNGYINLLNDKINNSEYLVFPFTTDYTSLYRSSNKFNIINNVITSSSSSTSTTNTNITTKFKDQNKPNDIEYCGDDNELNQIMNLITIEQSSKYSLFNIELISNKIINGDNNRILKFYENLFENYKSYFFFSTTTSTMQQQPKLIIKNFLINLIIQHDNKIALKVLINNYNYKPRIDQLLHSINLCNFKIANYLIKYHFKNNIDNNYKLDSIIIRSKIGLLSEPLFNLYKTCFIIEKIYNQTNLLNSFINDINEKIEKHNNNNYNIENKDFIEKISSVLKNVEILTEIELKEMKFTEIEYNSIVSSFPINDLRVKKLIRMILPFNCNLINTISFYHLKYNGDDNDLINQLISKYKIIDLDIPLFRFGIFDFKSFETISINQSIFQNLSKNNSSNNDNNDNDNNNDKNRKIKFINQSIKYLKLKNQCGNHLFNILIGYNDLELIKSFYNNYYYENEIINKINFKELVKFIKSNYVFEFIFLKMILIIKENNEIKEILSTLLEFLFTSGNLELVDFIRQKLQQQYYNVYFNNNEFFEIMKKAISKLNQIPFKIFNFYLELLKLSNSNNDNDNDMIQHIFNKINLKNLKEFKLFLINIIPLQQFNEQQIVKHWIVKRIQCETNIITIQKRLSFINWFYSSFSYFNENINNNINNNNNNSNSKNNNNYDNNNNNDSFEFNLFQYINEYISIDSSSFQIKLLKFVGLFGNLNNNNNNNNYYYYNNDNNNKKENNLFPNNLSSETIFKGFCKSATKYGNIEVFKYFHQLNPTFNYTKTISNVMINDLISLALKFNNLKLLFYFKDVLKLPIRNNNHIKIINKLIKN